MPDLFVTLSHEILREYREYERTSTTALNAMSDRGYRPICGGWKAYLRTSGSAARSRSCAPNGGVMSIALAQEQPVSMMESGRSPA
jgi:N-methylhydantoinase A